MTWSESGRRHRTLLFLAIRRFGVSCSRHLVYYLELAFEGLNRSFTGLASTDFDSDVGCSGEKDSSG